MRTFTLPGRELTDDLVQAWTGIVDSEPSLSSPYFHPEFTRAVAHVRTDVFVSVVEDAGKAIAFFPYQQGVMRVGRPVGGPMSDYHGLIAPASLNLDAKELLRASGLSSWTFDHCPSCQGVFAPYVHGRDESPVLDLSMGYAAYTAGRRDAGSKQILKTEGLVRKLEREVGPVRFTAHTDDPATLGRCIEWKRAHYAEMGVHDIFGTEWTRELLRQILFRQGAGFSGVLSTLHVGDHLAGIHMGMRSRTDWHYWFPAYDKDMKKFSPGIILLLRMAQAAPEMGLSTIDLGKGATMYKERLASGSVPITDGRVTLPSLATSFGHLRSASEDWIRRSPFLGAARVPGRFVKRAEKWFRFR